MRQLTDDWEQRYRSGDVPWEDASSWPGLESTLARFVKVGARVLDVGCGFGVNTVRLAELGYESVGIDVSGSAIARARENLNPAGCEFRVSDFMTDPYTGLDAVFDRGCFHSFADTVGRKSFVRRVFAALRPGGIWIDVSGSADNGESPDQVEEMKLPRLSVLDIAESVEPLFEIVEIQKAQFGISAGCTDFDAFVAVLRRRAGSVAG